MSELFRVRRSRRALPGAMRVPARVLGVAVVALVAAVTVIGAAIAGGSAAAPASQVYIVQLAGEPAVTYGGGIAGLPATKPAKGEKIDPEDAKVAKYVAHLAGRHNAALKSVGGGQKLYSYGYAYNGFAATLTEAQAAALERRGDVLTVEVSGQAAPDTSTTPDFLGLTGPNGLWAQLGGPASGTNASNAGGAGEGIVVGVLDTGIWPEHPSVSDRVGGKLMYKPLPGNRWKGKCTSAAQAPGGSWDANLCNQKLIGARYYISTFEAFGGTLAPNDYRSPRDSDGHGTHTATTAAGNHGITPTGIAAGFGNISGMAPRARIAVYKTCWDDGDPDTGGCFFADMVAAIDQAVADGVDVINVSIGGTTSAFLHNVQVAAFNAAAAGVFMAMSAGNAGTVGSVAHPSPWVTTVGASTHPRPANGVVELGNGSTFNGVSQTKSTVTAPVIRAQDAGLAGADANLVRQCFSQHEPLGGNQATLDPAKVAGKIVVCERGGAAPLNARVDKSRAVQDAGGVGMILINTAVNSLNGDFHFVPTVHLQNDALAPVQTYAQAPGATATIRPGSTDPAPAPVMAAFSSRGPSAATADQLKPDLTAPGVDILAGYSPASLLTPSLFNLVSGTSMSSPHVAGLAALLKHRHPSWTPAMIKSALMTTGSNVVGTFAASSTASGDANRAFAQGAGHVNPTQAADPGLVFNNGPVDWIRFICGTGQLAASSCAPFGGPINPSDLNLASLAIGSLPGSQSVTRTVRSVGSTGEMYTASFSGLPGISASVSPDVFTIAPGASQALTITLTRTTAALNVYQSGFMTLTGSAGHVVRIPIVARPVTISAPAEVFSNGSDVSWTVRPGYDGVLNAPLVGLTPATEEPFTVDQDPDQMFVRTDPTGTVSHDVVVPPNSTFRAGIYEDAITPNDTDLDLYVYLGASLVGFSAGASSNEEVTLRTGGAGVTLTVYIHGWSTGSAPQASGTLFTWVVNADAGNTTLSGVGPATIGGAQTHTASFSGLAPGTRYLGEVRYNNGTAIIGRTVMNVRTP